MTAEGVVVQQVTEATDHPRGGGARAAASAQQGDAAAAEPLWGGRRLDIEQTGARAADRADQGGPATTGEGHLPAEGGHPPSAERWGSVTLTGLASPQDGALSERGQWI
jgi:hypothetical protein